MFRSSKLVQVFVLVGVLTAGLTAGAGPAAAQEALQVQRTGRFTPWDWDPRRPVPPYIPEEFQRHAESFGLAADVDHTITVRLGTTTLTLAPASGAAAPGSQSLGLLQVDSPDNPDLAGAYQLRLTTPPPVRSSRFARFAVSASALQLVRADGSVLASTQVANPAAYQQMAAQMMPAVSIADSAVWRDAKPGDGEEKPRRRFPWEALFKLLETAVTVLGPLIFG